MKLNDFYKLADALAPKSLSDEFCAKVGGYDNSGVLVNTGDDINAVLFSLDLSRQAVEKAVAYKVKLIVTHHPAIYGGQSGIRVDDFQPLGEKLVACIRNGISVVSMHLNLDCADGGIDESLQKGVQKSAGGVTLPATAMQHTLSQGGYGRVYSVAETTLGDLLQNMQKEFETSRIVTYGKLDRPIKKVASFCGSGADEKAVAFAVEQGADVIVSADFKHHVLTLANEKNLAVIALTHYASENYGFKNYYEKIRGQVGVPCLYHTDEELL